MRYLLFWVFILATPALAEPDCKPPVHGKCTCMQTIDPRESIGYNVQGPNAKMQEGNMTCIDDAMNVTYHDPAPPKGSYTSGEDPTDPW